MGMRFFFADSHDYVDPGFDFERDEFSVGRQVQRGDLYAHELFAHPPYDGILVSRSIVGDERRRGKYSTAQMMRFYRKGVADFLSYDPTKGVLENKMVNEHGERGQSGAAVIP